MDKRKLLVTILNNIVVAVQYETPSYDNAGGKGDRAGIMTITTSLTSTGQISHLINGVIPDNDFYFGTQAVAGKYIRVHFPNPVIITAVKWYQDGDQNQGIWKHQISSGGAFTDASAEFGAGIQDWLRDGVEIGDLSANVTPCTDWQMFGVANNSSSGPYVHEIEFKLGNQL